MNKTILSCVVFALSFLNLSALDITTTNGKVYKNVEVTNVLPDAIGFMYTKKDGTPVLRDVKMTLLSKDLQKKFNYSPVKAKEFTKKVAKFQSARDKLIQKHHKEDLKLFRQHQRFAKSLNHIKALLYAHRLNCRVHIIRPIGENCIGKVSTDPMTSKYGNLGSFYIRNLTGPQNQLLVATIYPTGETKSFQDGMFPVYDADLTKYALQLAMEHKTPSSGDLSEAPGKTMMFPANAPKKNMNKK